MYITCSIVIVIKLINIIIENFEMKGGKKKSHHPDTTFIVLDYFLLVFSSCVYFFMAAIIAFIHFHEALNHNTFPCCQLSQLSFLMTMGMSLWGCAITY